MKKTELNPNTETNKEKVIFIDLDKLEKEAKENSDTISMNLK